MKINEQYDVLIIGAGAVGCAIARELSRFKLKVGVLEKEDDVSCGASKANSGIVHGGYAEKNSSLKGRLCYKGRVQFEKLNKELNFGFKKTGSLVISFDLNDREELEALKRNGELNGLEDLKIIERDEILKIEPSLNKNVKIALYCEGAGICSPYEYVIALAENAVSNGVEFFLNSKFKNIKKEGDFFEVESENGTFTSTFLVNCAGLYADSISKMLGEDYFTIKPRKGEYIVFGKGTGTFLNTVVFQMPTKLGKGILVTRTYWDNLLIGPDAQDIEEKEDTGTDSNSLLKIFNKAKESFADLNIKSAIRTFSGLRAVSSTRDFIIEETKVKGFINVAGIQSPGLTSSPAIAEMVRDILKSNGLKLSKKENFNPKREPIIEEKNLSWSDVEKRINIEGEERIVCRCERVIEREIIRALSRGIDIKSIDAIKRRTRAGMGWCQGNFCRARVKALIEKYKGIKIEAKQDFEMKGVNRESKESLLKYF